MTSIIPTPELMAKIAEAFEFTGDLELAMTKLAAMNAGTENITGCVTRISTHRQISPDVPPIVFVHLKKADGSEVIYTTGPKAHLTQELIDEFKRAQSEGLQVEVELNTALEEKQLQAVTVLSKPCKRESGSSEF